MPISTGRSGLRCAGYGSLLVGLLCLALTSCGQGTSANARATAQATATPQPTATPQSVALTWQPATTPPGGAVAYTPAPSDGRVAYACGTDGTGAGALRRVVRTSDRGATWSNDADLPNSVGRWCALTVAANDPQTVAVLLPEHNASEPPLSTLPAFFSHDGGATWQALPAVGPRRFFQLATYQGVIYGSAVGTNADGAETQGVYASHDGGQSWTPLPSPSSQMQMTPAALWVNPQSGELLLEDTYTGGVGSTLYTSTDGGTTWAPVPNPPNESVPVTPVVAPNGIGWHICMAGSGGPTPQTERNVLICTENLGATWKLLPALNPSQQSPKGFTFNAPVEIFAITSDGTVVGDYLDNGSGDNASGASGAQLAMRYVMLAPGASTWSEVHWVTSTGSAAPIPGTQLAAPPVLTSGPGAGMLWIDTDIPSPPFVTAHYP